MGTRAILFQMLVDWLLFSPWQDITTVKSKMNACRICHLSDISFSSEKARRGGTFAAACTAIAAMPRDFFGTEPAQLVDLQVSVAGGTGFPTPIASIGLCLYGSLD